MSALSGTPPLAYRRRASPLHAARGTVAAGYCAALAAAALLTENPLVLCSLLLAVLAAASCARVGPQMRRAALRSAVPIFAGTVIVNLLVSRGGLTVFARLGEWGPLGQVDLTVEALVYGLVFGLRLLVVALACMLAVCAADPDQLLLASRRFSPRSALTVALATRMVPVLAQDARRLAEAQRCRPDYGVLASAGRSGGGRGRLTRARGTLVLVRATVASALDRSLDVAAVLEMRGYGADRSERPRPPRRGRSSRAPRSRHDLAFAAAAAGIVAVSLLAAATSLAPTDAYPTVHVTLDARVAAVSVLLFALALVPFADRRGIEP